MRTAPDTVQRADQRPIVGTGEHLLVVVAHPDDESFGCGSSIAAAARDGATVTVVCATPGDLGESHLDVTGAELAAVRLRELHVAAHALGVDEVIVLDYGDSGFDGPLPAGSLCAADEHAVAARLTGVLAAVEPDVVLTLDGSDGHRDHVRVRVATTVATAGYVAATGRPVRIYESSLPNSLMRAWLDEMRSVRPDTAYHAIDPASIGRPDAEITDVADRSDVLAVRERAIALHASQASPFDGLTPELRRAFLSVDHLVRVA